MIAFSGDFALAITDDIQVSRSVVVAITSRMDAIISEVSGTDYCEALVT